jgi:hypothetical protein
MAVPEEVTGVGTVVESPAHGPQLCLGAIMLSLPPQGGGPPITNWEWAAVTGNETLNGTTDRARLGSRTLLSALAHASSWSSMTGS